MIERSNCIYELENGLIDINKLNPVNVEDINNENVTDVINELLKTSKKGKFNIGHLTNEKKRYIYVNNKQKKLDNSLFGTFMILTRMLELEKYKEQCGKQIIDFIAFKEKILDFMEQQDELLQFSVIEDKLIENNFVIPLIEKI